MMASARGVVRFDAGKDSYRLCYGINALCDLEDRLGMGVDELAASMQSGMKLSMARAVFAAGLSTVAGNFLSEKEAGELMGEIGAARAFALIGEAFQAAFPEEAGMSTDDPRRRRGGTGSTS